MTYDALNPFRSLLLSLKNDMGCFEKFIRLPGGLFKQLFTALSPATILSF